MIIREGTRERDEDVCVATWLAALERRDGFAPPSESAARAHAKFSQPIVRLAVHNDGFALTVRASSETALLELIAVDPDAASRGLGRALLYDAIASAAASGYHWLELWVRRGNDRAVALYESGGFETTGEVDEHPLGGEPMLQFRRATLAAREPLSDR